MNARLLLVPALAGVLLVGCQTRTPAREVVLQLTSALPVSFSGVVEVDGKPETVSGRTPAELRYTGHTVNCQIEQGPENGLLTIEVKSVDVPQRVEMVTATTGPKTVAKGYVSFW